MFRKLGFENYLVYLILDDFTLVFEIYFILTILNLSTFSIFRNL